ncbi:MAG: hypothetical protein AAFS10_21480, partial [Myxococcota bacterium]
ADSDAQPSPSAKFSSIRWSGNLEEGPGPLHQVEVIVLRCSRVVSARERAEAHMDSSTLEAEVSTQCPEAVLLEGVAVGEWG